MQFTFANSKNRKDIQISFIIYMDFELSNSSTETKAGAD